VNDAVNDALDRLADERARDHAELARWLRHSRRQRLLRRAQRMETKAEHRMIEAWRRAADLRDRAGFPGP
jgi:hypothetical protein